MEDKDVTERLRKAVEEKAGQLKQRGYAPRPCACGMWADRPWIYLLVSNAKPLDSAGKKQRDRIVLGWERHMEECDTK